MKNQKSQILEALTTKHIEMINTDKLNTVNGGAVCIEVIDIG